MDFDIINANNFSDYETELLSVYLSAFTQGENGQFIPENEALGTLKKLSEIGFGMVAKIENRVAGMLFAHPPKHDDAFPRENATNFDVSGSLYIAEVIVDEQFRGKGVAKMLLKKAEQKALDNRYNSLILRVWDENKAAKTLYEKVGFQDTGIYVNQTKWKDETTRFTMNKIYMIKKISEDMKDLIAQTIDLQQGNADEKRAEIRDYFLKTWDVHEKLYTQLKSDDIFHHRGDPLRHVILFYLGHTAVFFINKLLLAKIINKRINPEFESIFAIGVDEMSWDDLDNNHYNWPPVTAVREYRDKAKELILKVIDETPLTLPIDWNNPFWIIMMGIEHERIHLETSSVLIRQLPIDEVVSGKFGERCPETGKAPANSFVDVKGGKIKLGKPENHPFYGWDNEYGKYEEEVADFSASKQLISNEEYLEFIEAGGYHTEELWTEEGWHWRNFKNAEMPLFWRKNGNEYRLRLVAEEIPMPWNWPVEINYLEAKAFANWRTKITGKTHRLPTEAEWYRMYEVAGLKDVMNWDKAPGNINLEYFTSPCPVDKFKQGDFYDVVGNVWQWTETPITGFSGFNVHPMYDDFSTPTFDSKHNLIKGGSWISTGNEATYHSRYAFRRHFYQHAGLRLVQSETPLNIRQAEYETDEEVTRSCETNWGEKFSEHPNFSVTLVAKITDIAGGNRKLRVLDLNADTGRLAFELAKHFDDVTALDFTARMIRMPIQLQEQGFMRYVMKDEGELQLFRDVVLTDFGLESGKDNILFMQADAMNLRPIYTGYDVIVVPNLLEELHTPKLFLEKIAERLTKNGLLIITSTYDWDVNKTKRENWLGGFKKDGEPVTSLDGIEAILSQEFDRQGEPVELDLFLKKSSRITVHKTSQLTVWRKKA